MQAHLGRRMILVAGVVLIVTAVCLKADEQRSSENPKRQRSFGLFKLFDDPRWDRAMDSAQEFGARADPLEMAIRLHLALQIANAEQKNLLESLITEVDKVEDFKSARKLIDETLGNAQSRLERRRTGTSIKTRSIDLAFIFTGPGFDGLNVDRTRTVVNRNHIPTLAWQLEHVLLENRSIKPSAEFSSGIRRLAELPRQNVEDAPVLTMHTGFRGPKSIRDSKTETGREAARQVVREEPIRADVWIVFEIANAKSNTADSGPVKIEVVPFHFKNAGDGWVLSSDERNRGSIGIPEEIERGMKVDELERANKARRSR